MSTCRYVASDEPRVVKGRHDADCPGDDCPGCQPCTEPHCRVCGRTHVDGTCAECLAETRDDLHSIAAMCGALPAEVLHRGVESEAMTLLGPAADPEAWGHLTASVQVGRLPDGYLSACEGELHPEFVLGRIDMVWRAELDHDELTHRGTIAEYVNYIDRQMTYMAGYEHAPFEDDARDLRRCRAHLEAVLHDGEQIDRGAPCMTCGRSLLRVWGGGELPWSYRDGSKPLAGEDGWACGRCREWRSDKDYRLNVADLHREEAEWLTDRDMEVRTGVKAGTVRVWANRDEVKRKRDSGRTLYAVADVVEKVRERSTA